jgi:hypothetical protein
MLRPTLSASSARPGGGRRGGRGDRSGGRVGQSGGRIGGGAAGPAGFQALMPTLAASRAAAVRDETPILARTAETWWCTVRSEMNSRWEISRSGRPSVSSARTSRSRAVSPAGSARVARRAPGGSPSCQGPSSAASPPRQSRVRPGRPGISRRYEALPRPRTLPIPARRRTAGQGAPTPALPAAGHRLPPARRAPEGQPGTPFAPAAGTARWPGSRPATDRPARPPGHRRRGPPQRQAPAFPTARAVQRAPPAPERPTPARLSPRRAQAPGPAKPTRRDPRAGRGWCPGFASGRAGSPARLPGWPAPPRRGPRPRPTAPAAATYRLGLRAGSAC